MPRVAEAEGRWRPEVRPWVRRLAEAAGVRTSGTDAGESILGWWGVEIARFLRFARSLPPGTDLVSALEGYGRYLQTGEQAVEEWRLRQVREALRVFRRGTENWSVERTGQDGESRVGFRVKTRVVMEAGPPSGGEAGVPSGSGGEATAPGEWLERAVTMMRVRRMAERTIDSYAGWQRRYLEWCWERRMELATREAFEGFVTWQAVERRVSAATQNQAFSAILFLTSEVMGEPVEGIEGVRAQRGRHLPVVLSGAELRRLFAVAEGGVGLVLRFLYGTGLRQMECLRLRVKDVDLERRTVMVRDGKGGKDRRVMVPAAMADELAQDREEAGVAVAGGPGGRAARGVAAGGAGAQDPACGRGIGVAVVLSVEADRSRPAHRTETPASSA